MSGYRLTRRGEVVWALVRYTGFVAMCAGIALIFGYTLAAYLMTGR